jgi:hypothetical protein
MNKNIPFVIGDSKGSHPGRQKVILNKTMKLLEGEGPRLFVRYFGPDFTAMCNGARLQRNPGKPTSGGFGKLIGLPSGTGEEKKGGGVDTKDRRNGRGSKEKKKSGRLGEQSRSGAGGGGAA